jgi:hypothetical protein
MISSIMVMMVMVMMLLLLLKMRGSRATTIMRP